MKIVRGKNLYSSPPEVKSIESNDNKIKKENGSNEKLPEKVKSDGGVKIEDEDTDNETDNDTQPSQVESNDKIKKENYGPYDEDTDGEEQPEEVKSNNLDVKIEEEDTRTMNESKDMQPVTNPSLG